MTSTDLISLAGFAALVAALAVWAYRVLVSYEGSPGLPEVIVAMQAEESISKIRREALAAWARDVEFSPCTPEQYGCLDLGQLEQATAALRELGFDRVTDCGIIYAGESAPGGFARLMFHPLHKCSGEVNSIRNYDNGSAFTTIASEMNNGHTLHTSNRPASLADFLHRHPQLFRMFLPRLLPHELVTRHLEARRLILEKHSLVLVGSSDEDLQTLTVKARNHQRVRFEQWKELDLKSEFRRVIANPPGESWEWLGEESTG